MDLFIKQSLVDIQIDVIVQRSFCFYNVLWIFTLTEIHCIEMVSISSIKIYKFMVGLEGKILVLLRSQQGETKDKTNLRLIQRGPEELLRWYISQFNKEARAADNLQLGLMLMLAKDGVRRGSPFFICMSKMLPNTSEEFLKKVENYINHENVLEARKLKMEENQYGTNKKWQAT